MSNKTILIRPIYPAKPDANMGPLFRVTFQGVREGHKVEVEFWNVSPKHAVQPQSQGSKLAIIKGRLQRDGGKPESPLFTLQPDSGPAAPKKDKPQIGVVFAATGNSPIYYVDLPAQKAGSNEGDTWTLQACIKAALPHTPGTHSAAFPVTYRRRAMPARFAATRAALGGWETSNAATYDWHAGNDLILYNDASTDATGSGGAFYDLRHAIQQAEHCIYIADWSFHPAMRLDRTSTDVWATVGALLIAKAKRHDNMCIAVHTWTHSNLGAPDDQNNHANDVLDVIAKQMGYPDGKPKNLLWRSTDRTGWTWSHHQKFVVLDCSGKDERREIKAFFGGLDLTKGRFDWPGHPIMADETDAHDLTSTVSLTEKHVIGSDKTTAYDDWYNAEFRGPDPVDEKKEEMLLPREPWHDIYAQITGPTAWDVVREFVGRWQHNASHGFNSGDLNDQEVKKMFLETLMTWQPPTSPGAAPLPSMPQSPNFVQQWEPRGGIWAGQVLRSLDRHHWDYPETNAKWNPNRKEFHWHIGGEFERSIQSSYLNIIDQAQNYIYIETQYFCGSGAANPIPNALGKKMEERIGSDQPFHLYLLMPMYPEGAPDDYFKHIISTNGAVRVGEWRALSDLIARIDAAAQTKGKAWEDYFTLGYLARSCGAQNGGLLSLADCKSKGKDRRKEMLRHNRRHMVYIHSKLMLVDDRYLILGSANLNQRSIAGDRDSEICIAVWPSSPEKENECIAQIADFRKRLWAEHLGAAPEKGPTEAGQAFREAARKNFRCFYSGLPTVGFGHFMHWPIHYERDKKQLTFIDSAFDGVHIPDGLNNDDWRWWPQNIKPQDTAL